MIILGFSESWSTSLRTSKHHLVASFLEFDEDVLYLEVPINVLILVFRLLTFNVPRLVKFDGKFTILRPVSLIPNTTRLGFVSNNKVIYLINQFFIEIQIKLLLHILKQKTYQYVCYLPVASRMLQKNSQNTILHVVDEWDGFTALSHSIKNEITKFYLSVDTVIFASTTLRDQFYSKLGQRSNVVVLPHGLGFDPKEYLVKGLKNRLKHFDGNDKTIGYYGAFSKLDLELIIKVANLLPALKFELAGPIDDLKKNSDYAKYCDEIANTNNIIFVGKIAHVGIPNFVASISCLWFPFKINTLTEKMSPIKLYEGLSLGVPIVSTNLEGIREIAKDCILYAVTLNQHISCIEMACTAKSAQSSAVNATKFKMKSWKTISKDFLKEIKKC